MVRKRSVTQWFENAQLLSGSKTLSYFSACCFLIEDVLCSELIICCYNMDIKDLPPSRSYVRLRADSKDKAHMPIAAAKSDESEILINYNGH